ncbi:MAG: phenylalanine--tRNA ligase subunit beta [Streptosporangiaceae bacterium]|nr:phenylalanine--tRNA ligase subunit beta [Streptosporangiaceae bacterium]MBV9856280.1 phenylalanine--tRNA ligase subunit beta [Streptosporangiaceae bacterium]
MRVPLSWLRAYAELPDPVDAAEVARRLTAAGLEVESAEPAGHDIRGVVIGQVLSIEELTGFKKPIRYCRVAVSPAQLGGDPGDASGVICGAANFAVGDRVPLALPGAVLPGAFEIGARRAYGRMSEGMICSASELAIGDDHTGILVLDPDAPLGEDFVTYARLRDEVLEIAVTPDRGYAVSVRGVARELASAFGVPFTDPARAALPGPEVLGGPLDDEGPDVWPARIEDPTACDRFVLREVRGFDPAARTPLWMRVRLARCGVRSVSLAVDVTNYLMLELGQPLHPFDRSKLHGEIVVRRARPGERLETLDHVRRDLDPADILITDASGPISMAGTMGGLSTEIDERSTDLVIEAAHFSPEGTAKMSRRHKLHSEASYRFERGADRELPLPASAKAVALLSRLGGGRIIPGCTHAQAPVEPVRVSMAADYPDRVAGVVYGRDTVVRRLRDVGCEVREGMAATAPTIAPWRADRAAGAAAPGTAEHGRHDRLIPVLEVTPPSWRSDLTDPADLAEEVIRLEGYENIPARMPRALAGHGLTARQRLRRTVGRALGGAGFVEVHTDPFASPKDSGALSLPPEDLRRPAVRVANPLSEDEPLMRTTLLPGLFRVLLRNIGRGFGDLALFETGLVFRPRPGAPSVAPILPVNRGPSVQELAALEAALPDQPLHVAAVLAGACELPGWWGPGRAASWPDAVEAAREIGRACHLSLEVRADKEPPWHPGRCAALYVLAPSPGAGANGGARAGGEAGGAGGEAGGASGEQAHEWLAGHAGELHPRVIAAYGLPARTCALELDLQVLFTAAEAAGPVRAPQLSSYPVATQDVALVVPSGVAAASVQDALEAGAGDLLEDVRLFDVYTGEQLGEDRKSLAYTLRFRAPDRTLTVAETTAARDAAVAEAARRVGAELRGG